MWWTDWAGAYGPMPWMFFGPVMMFLLVLACFAVIYVVMHGARSDRYGGGKAIDILKERFARGEIDQAEFEARRRLLQA